MLNLVLHFVWQNPAQQSTKGFWVVFRDADQIAGTADFIKGMQDRVFDFDRKLIGSPFGTPTSSTIPGKQVASCNDRTYPVTCP